MTEQIDNLLTPRVMVTNEWPGGQAYEKGQVFTQMIEYCLIRWGRALPERPTMTRYLVEAEDVTAADLCTTYKGNFRLLHWAEGREPEQMPQYLRDEEVVWEAFNWLMVNKTDWQYDTPNVHPVGGYIRPKSAVALPATSAQYLEYLNQQSKP